jgi:adenosylcobyric acid synthase
LRAASYLAKKTELLPPVLESFAHLARDADIILVEGAGSPAEINLRAGDIANMGFARAADVPVVLVGDIDRGHVIAALVGAHAVLDDGDRAMIRGFLINKFRGDPSLFQDGRTEITRRTGWADLGMAPWLAAARALPAEDAVVLDRSTSGERRRVRIVAPMLSRIANFDDFDALRVEPDVDFAFVPPGQPLPGDADLVILPGTKATLADLAFLRTQGWDIDLAAHVRRGGRVLGVCGGYQMLGRTLSDPDGVEGPRETVEGLGLLEVDTTLTGDKTLRPVMGRLKSSEGRFDGYEMHVGRTTGSIDPMLILDDGGVDGAVSADGRIMGCYVHGLFNQGSARRAFLEGLGARSDGQDQSLRVDRALDEIAAVLEHAFDIEALALLAGLESRS